MNRAREIQMIPGECGTDGKGELPGREHRPRKKKERVYGAAYSPDSRLPRGHIYRAQLASGLTTHTRSFFF